MNSRAPMWAGDLGLDRGEAGFGARAAAPLLMVLSHAWRLGMYLDRALTPRRVLPRPVVSVGNISLGGTGKTPFVMYLARRFTGEGLRPAVLTRGYRSDGGRCDEPREIADAVPGIRVLVDRDRHRAALRALGEAAPPHVFILDDGFQHWALARDVDVVLVDALRPFGTGKIFPAGTLRESVRALNRAHAVVVTRADLASRDALASVRACLQATAPDVVVAYAREHVCGYTDLAGAACAVPDAPVMTACGIGNPGAFSAGAAREGLSVAGSAAMPDHYRWGAEDVTSIESRAMAAGARAVLTTAKDATKIRPAWTRMPWVVMAIETRMLEGEEPLWSMIGRRVIGESRRND